MHTIMNTRPHTARNTNVFHANFRATALTTNWYTLLIVLCISIGLPLPFEADAQSNAFPLGAGDMVKITVFRNPDLTTETRISETGELTFPLIGQVPVSGASTTELERRIGQLLKAGGYIAEPQVNVTVVQFRSAQIAVLGQVNKPGRYPLEGTPHKITDLLAIAGGVTAQAADAVTVVTWREGVEQHLDIDLPVMFTHKNMNDDIKLSSGDVVFVPRAPVFYIYGEVQRAGQYRLERDMTVLQTLAAGGGLTPRATQRGIRVHRRDPDGKTLELTPKLNDLVRADDVIYVRESIF
jgi:polysaccharide export outer membrane protein